MMISDDKVGGWVKKGQNHDDVTLECPLLVSFSQLPAVKKTLFLVQLENFSALLIS